MMPDQLPRGAYTDIGVKEIGGLHAHHRPRSKLHKERNIAQGGLKAVGRAKSLLP